METFCVSEGLSGRRVHCTHLDRLEMGGVSTFLGRTPPVCYPVPPSHPLRIDTFTNFRNRPLNKSI